MPDSECIPNTLKTSPILSGESVEQCTSEVRPVTYGVNRNSMHERVVNEPQGFFQVFDTVLVLPPEAVLDGLTPVA